MGNAAQQMVTGQSANVGSLTERQWEGLGKVGDAAQQVDNLIQLIRDILTELPEAVDTEKWVTRIQPQLEALRETSQEVLALLHIESVEDAAEQIRGAVQALREAKLAETLPELLALLGALHDNGFFASMKALAGEVKCPLMAESPEALAEHVRTARESLQYWLATARQGMATVGDVVAGMNLPEKIDEIQDLADQWLRVAQRAKRLVQGESPDLVSRVNALMGMAEALSGQISVALGTLRDTAPEVLRGTELSTALANIGEGGSQWFRIAIRLKTLAQGDAESVAIRVNGLLDTVEHFAGYADTIGYFLEAGKQGLAAARGMIEEMRLLDKVDELQEMADQWLKIAMRAKRLAQGDAESVAAQVNGLLDVAEAVSAQLSHMSLGLGTFADVTKELWTDGTISSALTKVQQGAIEWVLIARQATLAVRGNAPSLQARVKELVQGLYDAHLVDMLPELLAMLGAVQKAGVLRKANTLMQAALPLLPSDEAFNAMITKGVNAFSETQREMQGRSGSIFGIFKILFAKETRYLIGFFATFLGKLR